MSAPAQDSDLDVAALRDEWRAQVLADLEVHCLSLRGVFVAESVAMNLDRCRMILYSLHCLAMFAKEIREGHSRTPTVLAEMRSVLAQAEAACKLAGYPIASDLEGKL